MDNLKNKFRFQELEQKIPPEDLDDLKRSVDSSIHVLVGEQCLNSELPGTTRLHITVEQLRTVVLASMEYGYIKGAGK